MSRQNKKERQRLKRKRKQMQLRKGRNASIFQKLAGHEGAVEFFINDNWRAMGEASIMAFRPGPGGGIFVAFLIDLWCSGLKDAFGQLNVTRHDFERHLQGPAGGEFEMIPLDPSSSRRLIAGAMRLSLHNGFRLPRKADRWASIVGVAGYADADLSDFEKPDGRYRYVGTPQDLRRRLIGSVEQFLERPDVSYILRDKTNAWMNDVDDDEEVEDDQDLEEDEQEEFDSSEQADPTLPKFIEMVQEIRDLALQLIEEWLTSTGHTPHPRLRDGLQLTLMGSMMQKATNEFGGEPPISMQDMIDQESDPQGLLDAVTQVLEFSSQSNIPPELREVLLLGQAPRTEDPASTPLQPH